MRSVYNMGGWQVWIRVWPAQANFFFGIREKKESGCKLAFLLSADQDDDRYSNEQVLLLLFGQVEISQGYKELLGCFCPPLILEDWYDLVCVCGHSDRERERERKKEKKKAEKFNSCSCCCRGRRRRVAKASESQRRGKS